MKQQRIKLPLLIFICLMVNSMVFAQKVKYSKKPVFKSQSIRDQTQKREFGIRVSGINSYGAIYKKQKVANKYKRYRIAFLNTDLYVDQRQTAFNGSLAFSFGNENRVELGKKGFSFFHGLEKTLSASYRSSRRRGELGLSLGYVLGFQVDVFKYLTLSMETIPYISAKADLGAVGARNSITVSSGLDARRIAFSLVYKFNKAVKT